MARTQRTREAGWKPDTQPFGARLMLVRQHMGWSNAAKAARECGLSDESWRRWEGQSHPPADAPRVAGQIAAATGVDVMWLLYGDESPGDHSDGGSVLKYATTPALAA